MENSELKSGSRDEKLRVILLTHGGAELVLKKLLALDNVKLVGVMVETETIQRRSLKEKIKRSIRYDGYWSTAKKFARAFFEREKENAEVNVVKSGQQKFSEEVRNLGLPVHLVASYHAEESMRLMREAEADLGIIYGTNIVKESVFSIPRLGSINLHQGLAPYYRGGPPIFWELYNDEKEVGLTVHYVAAKVDTGDIILQETVSLVYDYRHGDKFEEFISEFSVRLKEPSAELVAEAVRMIAEGCAPARAQDTSLGKRYRLPTKKEKDELRRRLRERQRISVKQISRQSLMAEE